MKLRQSEASFDSICSQRVTRQSKEGNTKLIKKLPKATQNHNITSKIEKGSRKNLTESYSKISLDDIGPKRHMTRSSSGSVTGSLSKKPNLTSNAKTKSSKQQKIPNKTQQKSDYGSVKKPILCTISISESGDIDPLSSVSQSNVKSKKASIPVLKKKSDVILSRPKSSRQSVVNGKNIVTPKATQRMTRNSLDVMSSQSIRNRPKTQSDVSTNNSISPKVSRRVTHSSLDVISSKSICNRPESQPVASESNLVSPKVSRRVTRSSLGNAAPPSTRVEQPKLSASSVVQLTRKQLRAKKGQASKEKLSSENEDSKRPTRNSSLANANSSSVSLRNKSPRSKSPTKPTLGKQTKKKPSPEKENLEHEDSSSESLVVTSPRTRSSPKKTMPKDTLSFRRASRSSKLPNTSILSSDSDTTQNGNNGVKPTNTRNTRLSALVLSTSSDSSSETKKKSTSTRSSSSLALETKDKKFEFKKPRGVKRKSNTPPAMETKRKRKMPSITPASEEDPVSSQGTSAEEILKKHTRRHTVDVVPKTKRPSKNSPVTQQKGKKKSATVKGTSSRSAKTVSSRSTPDISLLPLDEISTFAAKRPKSAPPAIKKKSPSKGSTSIIPRKGTLKRKRWLAEALKEKNKSYEDDIFENQKFASPFRIPTEADDESDTSIATPKFGFFLTPAVAKRTPKFKDIISPSNLVKARKNAEEYLYRRQNRNKKNKIISLKTPASSLTKAPTKLGTIPEKKKLEFAEAMDKIQTIKSTIAAKDADESDEEDADNYLSDLSS